MSKEQRDAEIDRICDIAVAEENTWLANGGITVGDQVDESQIIEHDGGRYLRPQSTDDEIFATAVPPPSNEGFEKRMGIIDRVNYIRTKVPTYPDEIRRDAGYLLEVIDGLIAGRL